MKNLVSAVAQRRCLQAGLTLSHEDTTRTDTHTHSMLWAREQEITRPWHVEPEYKDTAKHASLFCKHASRPHFEIANLVQIKAPK